MREVFEETGAPNITVLGEAWRRESFVDARMIYLKQRYFLVNASWYDPKPANLSEEETDWVREYKW